VRVSAACFAELNPFCFFRSELGAVSDFFSEAACKENPRSPKAKVVRAITEIREDLLTADLVLIVVSNEVLSSPTSATATSTASASASCTRTPKAVVSSIAAGSHGITAKASIAESVRI